METVEAGGPGRGMLAATAVDQHTSVVVAEAPPKQVGMQEIMLQVLVAMAQLHRSPGPQLYMQLAEVAAAVSFMAVLPVGPVAAEPAEPILQVREQMQPDTAPVVAVPHLRYRVAVPGPVAGGATELSSSGT